MARSKIAIPVGRVLPTPFIKSDVQNQVPVYSADKCKGIKKNDGFNKAGSGFCKMHLGAWAPNNR